MADRNGFLGIIGRFGRKKTAAKKPPAATRHLIGADSDFEEFIGDWGTECSTALTVKSIGSLLRDADQGSPAGLAALYRRMLESEPAVAAHLQTRVLAVLACDWSVTGDDPERAAEAGEILRRAGLHSLLRHLLDALAFGYSGAAILWGEGGGNILGFKHIDPLNWVFDLAGNPALVTLEGREKSLAEYHENQFVFHTHSLRTANPARGGLLRPLVWLYFFKHYAMRDRARYLERFGIPFIAAKVRNEDFESENVRDELMRSLAKLGSDGVGLLNEGSEMQIVSASGGAQSDYQTWLEYLDSLCALLLLGQTATSGDASGISRGQIQENVRRDLVEADCRALMETVETKILAPLERFRWGTAGTLRFKLDFASPENLVEKAEIVQRLAAAGLSVSREWARQAFGIELENHI